MIAKHLKLHYKRYFVGIILLAGVLLALLAGGKLAFSPSMEGRRYAQLEARFAELQESFNKVTPRWWTSSACNKEHPLASTVCAINLTRNEVAGSPKLLNTEDIPKYELAIRQAWPDGAITVTGRDNNGFRFTIAGYPSDFACAFKIIDYPAAGATGGVWCEGLAERSHYRHVHDIDSFRTPK
jgi:hypothetical protein